MTRSAAEILRERGFLPSIQRVAIFDYILKSCDHPNAEKIYKDMMPKIPTLTRTTVNNTLRMFSEKGAISTVTIEEKEMRFDAHIEPHGHFKCKKCGKLFDFPLENTAEIFKFLPLGHEISETKIYLHGNCADCA